MNKGDIVEEEMDKTWEEFREKNKNWHLKSRALKKVFIIFWSVLLLNWLFIAMKWKVWGISLGSTLSFVILIFTLIFLVPAFFRWYKALKALRISMKQFENNEWDMEGKNEKNILG